MPAHFRGIYGCAHPWSRYYLLSPFFINWVFFYSFHTYFLFHFFQRWLNYWFNIYLLSITNSWFEIRAHCFLTCNADHSFVCRLVAPRLSYIAPRWEIPQIHFVSSCSPVMLLVDTPSFCWNYSSWCCEKWFLATRRTGRSHQKRRRRQLVIAITNKSHLVPLSCWNRIFVLFRLITPIFLIIVIRLVAETEGSIQGRVGWEREHANWRDADVIADRPPRSYHIPLPRFTTIRSDLIMFPFPSLNSKSLPTCMLLI